MPNIDRNQIMEQIGTNLKKLREALDWTQAKMAELMGVTTPTLGYYFNATRMPAIESLVQLCALDDLKNNGIILTINDFLSSDFNPKAAIERKENGATSVESNVVSGHKDAVGCYLSYFYNQSNPIDDGQSTIRDFRYGVITIYDDYNCITGEQKMRVLATYYKDNDEKRNDAIELKERIDAILSDSENVAARNAKIQNLYNELKDSIGVYEGEATYTQKHTFINLSSDVYSDNGLIILYSPQKKSDNMYIGGIGSVASVSHGRNRMPTAQKMILSRYVLDCSKEEIAEYINMYNSPEFSKDDIDSITDLCEKLYSDESELKDGLDKPDKEAIIRNRLLQIVKSYFNKNICCVSSISEVDDKRVFDLISRNKK